MTDPGSIPFDRQAMAPERRPVLRPEAQADQLWHEHGWGLGGVGTGTLVLLVLLASLAARLLG